MFSYLNSIFALFTISRKSSYAVLFRANLLLVGIGASAPLALRLMK